MMERFVYKYTMVIDELLCETYCRTVCCPRLNVSRNFGKVAGVLTLPPP